MPSVTVWFNWNGLPIASTHSATLSFDESPHGRTGRPRASIFSETGGYQGIGFAVPGNLARHVMDDLLKYGEVQRGTIPGIQIANLTTQIAEELGAPNTRGALINQIAPRSDAYAAGLRAGDIITSFNGRTVEDAAALMRMLADSKVGTAGRLEILRESRRLDVTVPITRSLSTRRGR
jgi:S1-C subfamily serine protease